MTKSLSSFGNRLAAIKRRAGLSDKELALWFNSPKSTVQSWLQRGVQPHWYRRDEIDRRMKALEKVVGKKLPLPSNVRQGERLNHVRAIRDGAAAPA